MVLEYTYLPCRFCVGKNHCEQCGEEICGHLEGTPGLLSARVEIVQDKVLRKETKLLHLELAPGADENAVFDVLEEIGVFV
jgi:hypothetical protein